VNANHLAFPAGWFDLVICGFMGWDDCYDFELNKFTQPESKAKEIYRVLRDGGRFVVCSWEAQQDIRWMEDQILKYYPEILEDDEYLSRRPIGMAYESARGYERILGSAGFREIKITREGTDFVSSDEMEWWVMMLHIGWDTLVERIERVDANRLKRVRDAILADLRPFRQSDGIHFTKSVFFVSAVKT